MAIPTPEPRIERFEKLGYGLFIHWGLYSQLKRGEWALHLAPEDPAQYEKLADTFTAADFDAHAIAAFARKIGMRYITLTTRHHDGFSLYDTRGLNDYDAPHSAAGRDLIAEFVEGCRANDILPVFYHTTLDWRWDTANCDDKTFDEYLDYHLESVRVLCSHYGPVGGLWFDGNWSRADADWKEDRLYALIRELQPEAMIINNTGLENRGNIGHPMIDSTTYERGLPGPIDREGLPKYVAGEMCQTFNQHWGIAENDFNVKSPATIIRDLAACRKVGANFLMNIGPTATGAITDYDRASLEMVGKWVNMHAAALYETKPLTCDCMGDDFVLQGDGKLYYFAHNLLIGGTTNVTLDEVIDDISTEQARVVGGVDGKVSGVKWMDNDQPLSFKQEGDKLTIDCAKYPYGTDLVVRVAEILLV